MSNKILEKIIEKINSKGFKVNQTHWGTENAQSKDERGVSYITFASDNLDLIVSNIIGQAAVIKKPGKQAFNKDKEHLHIDWRIYPEWIEYNELYNDFGYYRARLTVRRVCNEQ
jgi:hypothetical protein